jgi:hypothetical protein
LLLVTVYCLAVLISALWLVIQSAAGMQGGRTLLGTPDYAGFYVAAAILNQGQPERLYDEEYQYHLLHSLLPRAAGDVRYPFGHAPVIAFLLRPLARIPFDGSYRIWLVIVAAIALLSLGLLRGAARAIPRGDWSLIVLVSLTFPPLIVECWLAGQLSVIGLVCIALAFRSLRLGRPAACGLALAMCLYKPTLLLFCLPVLVLSGQGALIAGLAAGGLLLALLTVAAVGTTGSLAFLQMLATYTRHAGAGMPGFKVFKQVDLNSFLTLSLGPHAPGGKLVMGLAFLAAAAILLRTWHSCRGGNEDSRILVMGATITWNSVFNLYTPIYDLSVLIPGLVMTADYLYRMTGPNRPRQSRLFIVLMVSLIAGEWYSQTLARDHGFQLLTPILVIVGAYQLALARGAMTAAICPDPR